MQLNIKYASQKQKNSFLYDVAAHYIANVKGKIPGSLVVFPNRRSAIFFERELKAQLNSPSWLPGIISLEDYIFENSKLIAINRQELLLTLHDIFKEVDGRDEGLEDFFFWGEMLLNDFDDIDQQMVNPDNLFRNIEELKEIESIEYLNEEQKKLVERFWKALSISKNKAGWLKFWSDLKIIYNRYRKTLLQDNVGYKGLIYRDFCDNLDPSNTNQNYILFAGFNALTKAEELIITHFLQYGNADILWDTDAFYLKDYHEAGRFLRKYRQSQLLGKYFIENDNISKGKNITEISVSTWSAQAKVAGKIIANLSKDPNWREERTAIILPDESLVFNIVNSLPDVEAVNITMGVPLFYTNAFNLVINLINLQKNSRDKKGTKLYYAKDILAILKHPLINKNYVEDISTIAGKITNDNIYYYEASQLQKLNDLFKDIFGHYRDPIPDMVKVLVAVLNTTDTKVEELYVYSMVKMLEELNTGLKKHDVTLPAESLRNLLSQLSKSTRIPFEGLPLKGLQIMGLMESRNLDFDTIIVLSMNEGKLPGNLKANSFIPHGIRKAFNMFAREDLDSLQSYLFYRLFHKANNIFLIYNAVGDKIGGEKSRFLFQLEFEIPDNFRRLTADEKVNPIKPKAITVKKDDFVRKKLQNYITGEGKKALTPSALNAFLDCKLKFYFNKILNLYEQDEFYEQVDARIYGQLFHKVMEKLYPEGMRFEKGEGKVLKGNLDQIIDEAFHEEKIPGYEGGVFEGKNFIVRNAVKQISEKVIDLDEDNAPFEIVGAEYGKDSILEEREIIIDEKKQKVNLGSIIDRIDRKGNSIKVLDYKTGSDELTFESVEDLFSKGNHKRRKAVFQVFFYSMLAKKLFSDVEKITPSILSTKNISNYKDLTEMFTTDKSSKSKIFDYNEISDGFETLVDNLLFEVFNTDVFDQTEDEEICSRCPYANICHR